MSGQSSTNDNPRDKIDRWIPPLLPPKEPPATVPDGPHMESLPPDVAPPAQSEPPPSMDMPPPVPVEPPAPVPMPVPAPMPTPVLEPVPAPMPAPAPVPAPMPAPAPMPVPAPAPAPAPVPPIMPPEVVLRPCSEHYRVPATANPYFAGVADGASLLYRITQYDPPTPIDFSPMNAPVLVATIGDCITPGKAIYFSVAGNITFSRVDPPTDANGSINQIVRHQRGAQFGKSDIAAPINSLIGVFIGEGDPASQPAPAGLDFSTQAARDYRTLSPALGQVFFIGTGKTSAGDLRKVIVPSGAARLYFAVMDIYQWNNNSGELSGAVMVE
ncbi:MAG: hypothetical protein FJ146_15635 [Deltaproteobacteria bacterium]|nr:hypothetical protein [Deltaproteobacteria bacterium]